MYDNAYRVDYWEDQAETLDEGDCDYQGIDMNDIQGRPVKHWSTPWKIVIHPHYGKTGAGDHPNAGWPAA